MSLKIIDLEIDESLSASTKVEEVALVLLPAIETEFMYFGRQKFYKAPDYVAETACRAIRENEKRGNPAATQTGKVRAQQLCNQDEVSLETIKRMKSYLERAATYYTGDYDDNGTISYDLWGGKNALKWVDNILKQIENQEMDYDISNLPVYVNYDTGKTYILDYGFIEVNPGESEQEYVGRCMSSEVMKSEFPDERQRAAVCYSKYKEGFEDCGCMEKQELAITPNPCWDGYEPYGLKDDGSPNCIPVKNSKQEFELLGFIDGVPYFSSPEEAETYGEETYGCSGHHVHIDENGNEVYMSCMTHDDNGVELEDLLNQGWVIIGVNEVDGEQIHNEMKQKFSNVSKEEFYRIFSDPNENSIQDVMGIKIRYVYATGYNKPDIIKDTRSFCRRMLGGRQYVFRYEDIQNLNVQITAEDADRKIIPRPKGTSPDILTYKGGANCRHYWLQLIFGNPTPGEGYEEKITNNKDLEESKAALIEPAPGQAGKVNDKAMVVPRARITQSRGAGSVITVDIDDTLFDGITPNQKVIDYVNSKWSNHMIVILTGRKSSREGETIRELARFGIKYDELIMNDTDKPSYQYKIDTMKDILNKGIRISEAIENDLWTKSGYERLGIKVRTPETFAMIPSGFLQGYAVFEDRGSAEDYSYKLGCGGIVDEVTYMGKTQYQACSSKTKQSMKSVQFKSEDEKRMLYSPLMVPNLLIPRIDEYTNERYFVRFTPSTIEKIQQKFMIESRLRKTNLEHSNTKFDDMVMVESWIVSGDSDKAYQLGYNKKDIPVGTWMVGYKILETPEGDKIWNDFIKTGKVKGLSAEGEFMMNFSRQNKWDYLLTDIINILNQVN